MKLARFFLNPPAGDWFSFKGATSITLNKAVPDRITRYRVHDRRALRTPVPLELVLDLNVDLFSDELISQIAKRGPLGVALDVELFSFPEIASMAVSNGAKFVHLQHERRTWQTALVHVRWLRRKFPKLPIIVEPRSTDALLELAVAGADHFATGNPWRLRRWLRLFAR